MQGKSQNLGFPILKSHIVGALFGVESRGKDKCGNIAFQARLFSGGITAVVSPFVFAGFIVDIKWLPTTG